MTGKRRLRTAIIVAAVVLVLVLLILQGYEYDWTGFAKHVDSEGKTVPPKFLWDWLQLLVIPVFLSFGAWLLTRSKELADARIEVDRHRQKSLDDYLTFMSGHILSDHFPTPEGRVLTRTRTLTVLPVLDGERKAQVLQFLYEGGMLFEPHLISLVGADFRGVVLNEATLADAEIRGAYFTGAKARSANLRCADLRGCDFTHADFSKANLTGVDFRQAILRSAMLAGANINGVNVEDADMTDAKPVKVIAVLVANRNGL